MKNYLVNIKPIGLTVLLLVMFCGTVFPQTEEDNLGIITVSYDPAEDGDVPVEASQTSGRGGAWAGFFVLSGIALLGVVMFLRKRAAAAKTPAADLDKNEKKPAETMRRDKPAPSQKAQQHPVGQIEKTSPVSEPPVPRQTPAAEPSVPEVEKPVPLPIIPKPAVMPATADPDVSESLPSKKPEKTDSADDDILFKHLEMLRELKTNRQEDK